MTEPSKSRPQVGQWLLLLIMAGWLALVPLIVTAVLQALNNSPPSILTQLELVAPGGAILPEWFVGLVSMLLTLGLNLLSSSLSTSPPASTGMNCHMSPPRY